MILTTAVALCNKIPRHVCHSSFLFFCHFMSFSDFGNFLGSFCLVLIKVLRGLPNLPKISIYQTAKWNFTFTLPK